METSLNGAPRRHGTTLKISKPAKNTCTRFLDPYYPRTARRQPNQRAYTPPRCSSKCLDCADVATPAVHALRALHASRRHLVTSLERQKVDSHKLGPLSIGLTPAHVPHRLPRTVASHVSLLVPHLGCKAYPIRSGIVTAIGHLLHSAFEQGPDGDDAPGDRPPACQRCEGAPLFGRRLTRMPGFMRTHWPGPGRTCEQGLKRDCLPLLKRTRLPGLMRCQVLGPMQTHLSGLDRSHPPIKSIARAGHRHHIATLQAIAGNRAYDTASWSFVI